MVSHWNELTVKQFIDIGNLESFREVVSDEVYATKIISILSGIDEDDIMEMSEARFAELASKQFYNEPMKMNDIEFFKFKGKTYHIHQNMSELTLGEHLSIQQIKLDFSNPNDIMVRVLAILIREYNGDKKQDLTNKYFEFNIKNVLEMPVVNVLSVFQRYSKFEYDLLAMFPDLNEEDSKDGIDFTIGMQMPSSTLSIMDRLANGDITKFDEISNVNVLLAYSLLNLWKKRDKMIDRINKVKMIKK